MSKELTRLPPFQLSPGQEWWTDYPHRLTARLRVEQRKGNIEVIRVYRPPASLRAGALVQRVRPRRPEWERPAAIALGAVSASLLLATLAVRIWPVLLALLLLAGPPVAWRALRSRRIRCAGLHCQGCRHH